MQNAFGAGMLIGTEGIGFFKVQFLLFISVNIASEL